MSVKAKKTIEYIGGILPDGHLSIPDYVKEELAQYEFNNLSVTNTENSKTNIKNIINH